MIDVLGAVGNTSLVRLRALEPPNGSEIAVKLEWENPTGSVKDRGLKSLSTDLYLGP